MASSVAAPYSYFPDTEGDPLEGGNLYVGAVNSNPLIEANRVAIYSDLALTIPLAQPVRTLAGLPVNANGSPTLVCAAGASYSLVVTDKNGTVVWSNLNVQNPLFIYDRTALEIAAAVTPTNYNNPPTDVDNVSRYGSAAAAHVALATFNTVYAAGGRALMPAGTWTIGAAVTFSGQRMNLQGDGRNVSIFSYSPGGGGGVALSFGDAMYQGSIKGFGFTSSDSTAKTAVQFVNNADFEASHIGIASGAWAGASSVGIETKGRQAASIHHCEIYCAKPLLISNNATYPSLSMDHFVVQRCELASTETTGKSIEIADGTSFSNTTFSDLSLPLGKYGIYWNDTTSASVSFNLLIENIRTEQGTDAAGYSIYLNSFAGLQMLTVKNAYLDSTRNGIFIRNGLQVYMENVFFNMGAGKVALDMTFVAGSRLVMVNCFKQPSSTITLTNARCVRREISADIGIVEEYVYDSSSSAGRIGTDAYLGGVPFTLANNATLDFCDNSFQGFVIVTNGLDVNAIFSINGVNNSTSEVSDPSGQYSITQGTAGTNIYWNGGTSRYRIENKNGSSYLFSILRLGAAL